MPLEIHVFRCLSDNAGTLIRDSESGACVAIDVPDADQVLAAAKEKGWTISDIWITHAHGDHTQGVEDLKEETNAFVAGPQDAMDQAPVDRVIAEGDRIALGNSEFEVWHTPGHAPGHLSIVSVPENLALVGDVVFVMGCGRVAPGAMDAMWGSLQRIMALPDSVRLVTGHDYTLANARFAAAMDPANAALAARLKEAEAAKESGRFWAETTIGEERATNPFFRAGEGALAAAVGLVGSEPGAVFAALREAKNTF